jgi:hypothetical protein
MTAPGPGWYADPAGTPGQRYFDGVNWTEHRAPQPYNAVPTAKNPGLAVLLAFLFGPLGMFYSTVVGAAVMIAVYFALFWVGVFSFGLIAWLLFITFDGGWLLFIIPWIIGIAWAHNAAQNFNRTLPGDYPAAGENPPAAGAPDNNLVWGVLALICCLPFGIMSIVKATQVSGLWAQGQYGAAQAAADDAKKWAMWGAVAGAVVIVIYLLVMTTQMTSLSFHPGPLRG